MRKALFLIFLGLAVLFEGCKKDPVQIDSGVFAQCQGDSFRIDLLDTTKALPDDTVDQQMDQLRDWVWTTLLARVSAQSSQPELLAGVSRQPLVRNDSLSHLLEQPVGRARSTVGKDGTVYVLVQRSDPGRVADDVLEAIDRESFFLGEGPKAVEVYGVDFNMETAEAQVCKLASVDKAWLEGAGSGFREGHVKTTKDLAAFLDRGTDLLSASCSIDDKDEPVLDLTGRQRSRTARAPMTVEHVAALNREIHYVPTEGLPSAKGLPEPAKEQARDMGDKIDSAWKEAQDAGASPQIKGEDASTQKILDQVLAWKSENPQVPAAELLLSYQVQGMGDLGFSLDTKTDLPQVLHHLDELNEALSQEPHLLPLLKSWGMSADEALDLAKSMTTRGGSLQDIRKSLASLRAALNGRDPLESEKILIEAASFSRIVRRALTSAQYQSARYDGPLQGTEPAMTMFYTDLLAKLWAMDWHRCSPTGQVPGFVSVIDYKNSAVSCEGDQGVDNTRIWFGPRQEAYARDQATALRLTPNATRLYALGSTLGAEFSEEVEPSADMLRFIRWWDRHYEDVADWEPQYELLNQLMKWTLVRRMVEASDSSGCLSFLDRVKSGPVQRFDHWVASQRDLRWRGPVPLLNRPSVATESLPLFESEGYQWCSNIVLLSGGVSLPRSSEFAELPVREADPLPYFRRLNSVKPTDPLASGGGHYASLKLPRGQIDSYDVVVGADGVSSEGRLISEVMVRDSSGFRPKDAGPIGQSKSFVVKPGGNEADIRELRDKFGVGRLSVLELKSATPRIKFFAGAETSAKRLGLEISWHLQTHERDLKSAAKEIAGGVPVMSLNDGRVAIGPLPGEEGEQAYAVLSSGGGVRGPPPEGPRYVVGEVEPEPGGGEGGAGVGGSGLDGTGGRRSSVEIILVEDKNAKPYFRRQGAVEVPDSNPVAREVRERLDKGDLEGAEKAAAADDTPPRALTAIATEAVRRRRIDVVEAMVDRLVLHPEAAWEIRRTSKEVEVLRASLARGGKANEDACRRLSSCLLRLSIVADRLPPRDAARELARLGDQASPVFYAPNLPKFAHHPPIGYEPGHPPGPQQQEVLELVNSANRLADLPAQIRVGDFDFKLVHGSAPRPEAERQRISPWVGSSERLPLLSMLVKPGTDYVWPLPVVVRCVDRTSGQVATGASRWLPDCERPTGYGLTSAEAKEKAWKIAADLLACDLDRDGRISGPRERSCADSIRKENEPIFRSAGLQ